MPRVRIRQTFLISFAVSMTAVTLLVSIAIATTGRLQNHNETLSRQISVGRVARAQLMDVTDDLRIFQAEAIHASGPEEQRKEIDEIRAQEALMTRSAGGLSVDSRTQEGQRFAREIHPLTASYVAQSRKFRMMLAQDRQGDAARLFMTDMDATYDALIHRLESDIALYDDLITKAAASSAATHHNSRLLIWCAAAFALLGMAAICAFMLRTIWSPLRRMAEASRGLAAGNLEVAIPDADFGDELNALAVLIAKFKVLNIALISSRKNPEPVIPARLDILSAMGQQMHAPAARIASVSNRLLDAKLDLDQRDMADEVRESANALLDISNEIETIHHLVDLMDGAIWVTVSPDSGSDWWSKRNYTLPAALLTGTMPPSHTQPLPTERDRCAAQ